MSSTRVGTWALLKVRVDTNRELAQRFVAERAGTGDLGRTLGFLATLVRSSSNPVVVLRDDKRT